MGKDGIALNNFDDALKDDSPERLNAIVKTYTGASNSALGNNVLIVHLINKIKRLNKTTSWLSIIMIGLIIIQVILIYGQISH